MYSNLVTPPDILNNGHQSILIVDPEKDEVDAVIKFCQHSDKVFNVYVYTPNMDNTTWLENAVKVSDAIIVNSRTETYKNLCLLKNSFYYGPKNYVENQNKLYDILHYFAFQIQYDK